MITLFLVLSTIFIGSVMKGAIGIGLPLLATPVLSMHLGVPAAVSIVSIPIVATNIGQVAKFRAEIRQQSYLVAFLGAGSFGVLVGTIALVNAPVALLQIGLGSVVLLYLAMQLFFPPLVIDPKLSRLLGGPVGLVAGTLQGAVGISSVVSIAFLQALRLERRAFVGAISAMFLMFSTIQIVALVAQGTMTVHRAGLGLVSLLAAAVGMWVGDKIASRMTVDIFRKLIFAMLGLISGLLVLGGIQAL